MLQKIFCEDKISYIVVIVHLWDSLYFCKRAYNSLIRIKYYATSGMIRKWIAKYGDKTDNYSLYRRIKIMVCYFNSLSSE